MPLHMPKKSSPPTVSRYEILGLRDQPFPSDPVLNPYSTDDRKNGTIYAASAVLEQINKFERLLIRPDDFPNRVRLAYLWAKGDQESGRGMGKTALLQYFRQRINKDWGHSEFSGRFSAVVVYVSFPSQVDRRHIEQLALSGLVDICRNGVLVASRAALRYQFIPGEIVEKIIAVDDGEPNPENLLKDDILQENGINPSELDDSIVQKLRDEGVETKAALALARGQFHDYLCSFRKDGNLEPFYVPRDTKILDYSRTLLFNDVVNYLRTAGFAGGYLFIDDIENLVDQMARRERIEFAKEFGLCTVRPGYANTAYNFFSSVLTTHQQASVGLAHAWGDAGLSAIARLDPTSPHSIELPLPNKDQAQQIIIAHLDHYRIDKSEKGSIKPFSEDGIEALLESGKKLHPRVLLSTAANVISYAVEKAVTTIDATCVKSASEAVTTIPSADFSEGVDGAL
jgi:hypothetical protein